MSDKQKDVLKAFDFKFSKQYGQNFISDTNLLDAIVCDSGVSGNDVAVEIGTGAGALTAALAKKVKRVISFEVDKRLKEILELTLAGVDNAEVVFKDALKIPLPEIEEMAGGNYHVVANLPYYITTPLIMKFAEEARKCSSMTLMVQKEVADRLSATPGTKDYGSVTVAANVYGAVKTTRTVSRKMFYPQPNVDSAVVHIVKHETPFDCDKKQLRKVVKSAFAMRRKTLVNNLTATFGGARGHYESVLTELGFSTAARGETLSVDDFCNLTNRLFKDK
jgi:16S rRNA (adenine1518-N6/adenine1519-N6)-dimethyltransferase